MTGMIRGYPHFRAPPVYHYVYPIVFNYIHWSTIIIMLSQLHVWCSPFPSLMVKPRSFFDGKNPHCWWIKPSFLMVLLYLSCQTQRITHHFRILAFSMTPPRVSLSRKLKSSRCTPVATMWCALWADVLFMPSSGHPRIDIWVNLYNINMIKYEHTWIYIHLEIISGYEMIWKGIWI